MALDALKGVFKTPMDFPKNLQLRKGAHGDYHNIKVKGKNFVFVDNHDMQRASWIFKDKKEDVDNAVKILGSAGNSIVYYGTEVYLSQKRDTDQLKAFSGMECRRFMDWTAAGRKNTERFNRIFK